jgi:alkylation response protein AidB-like acyl-CoA dehydrogenase
VDFLPNEEQAQIIEAVSHYLSTEHPVSKVQAVDGHTRLTDPEQWPAMGDLGWFSIGLPDEFGGAGFSVAEETLVFIEAGKHLVSPSLLATVLGARVAAAAGNYSLARAIVSGKSIVAPETSRYSKLKTLSTC